MRPTLARIAVLLHVALLVVYLSWARGGSRPELYLPLLWLIPGLMEMVLLFPPARRQETPDQARRRVRFQLTRDPLLYTGLALMVFLAIQVLNGPCALVYDSARGIWVFSRAPVGGLPFCLSRGEAGQALYWFGAALAVALAVRHGLSRKAKGYLLEVLAANGALLALLGLLQIATGATRMFWVLPMPARFLSTFSYPSQAGVWFLILFYISGGLLVQAIMQEDAPRRLGWLGGCALLNLLAASYSLSPLILALAWGGVLLGCLYAVIYLSPRLSGSVRLRTFSWLLIVLGVLTFLHFVAYPENRLHQTTRELAFWLEQPPPAYPQEKAVLRHVAWQIWRDHPVYGIGTWGFHRVAGLHLDARDWSLLRPGEPVTPFSDPLQFLCELGAVGFGLLLACTVLLLVPVIQRLRPLSVRAPVSAGLDTPARLHSLPPLAAGCVGGVLSALACSPFGIPFRNPAVLLSTAIALAALPSLLPKPQPRDSRAEGVGAPKKGPVPPPRHRPSLHVGRGRARRNTPPGVFHP